MTALLCIPRNVASAKNRAHVERFERLERAFNAENCHASVCLFIVDGRKVRLLWDGEVGAALDVQYFSNGKMRLLCDGWDVEEAFKWVEDAMMSLGSMEGGE